MTIILDDSTPDHVVYPPGCGRGAVQRDYSIQPTEVFASPDEIDLIPRSEWSARIKEMEEQKSRVSDIINAVGIKPMTQGNSNYCWAHSTVNAVRAVRAINNQPAIDLSAFAVASTIKNGRNQGGWCGLSAEFLRERGVPSTEFWPQGDFRGRWTEKVAENASQHVVTEDFLDMQRQAWDRDLTFDQTMTALLRRWPLALDFEWWGHSVCGLDPVEPEPGSFGFLIWNSWKGWGDNGMAIIRGNKTRTMGAVAIRVTGGSKT